MDLPETVRTPEALALLLHRVTAPLPGPIRTLGPLEILLRRVTTMAATLAVYVKASPSYLPILARVRDSAQYDQTLALFSEAGGQNVTNKSFLF